jgi:crotonobetainyl-CoA:carnitine CoA-transferase CaiB-like acyl-CoA transferase
VMALEGADSEPKLPTTGMLNDFITGYLGAAGATAALIRRANDGGSYHVKVSLARTAMFVTSLGTVDPTLAGSRRQHRPLEPDSVTGQTCLGELLQLAPPVRFSETTPRWTEPILVPRSSSQPEWRST